MKGWEANAGVFKENGEKEGILLGKRKIKWLKRRLIRWSDKKMGYRFGFRKIKKEDDNAGFWGEKLVLFYQPHSELTIIFHLGHVA